ncbi:hypothetical protein [Pontibacter ruber]|uniref:Outer membrane protein beta-barrel domain-containing protein n=1 Tax=Pontibacter ruber TaxID=1343895 RepID=A0ABW5D061_9BACT|nr:hypothetical protein [Pontibacter ruber]
MLTDKEQEEIRRKLLGLEEEPPADGWGRILPEIQPQQKPRLVWWPAAAALLLLLSLVGGYYLLQDKPATLVQVSSGKYKQEQAPAVAVAPSESINTEQHTKQGKETSSGTGISLPADKPYYSKNSVEKPTQQKEETTDQIEKPVEKGTVAAHDPVNKEQAAKPVIAAPSEPQDKYDAETLATAVKADRLGTESADALSGVKPELQSNGAFVLPDSVCSTLTESAVARTETAADSSAAVEPKEWFIGVTAAPRYAFRSFTPTGTDDIYITKFNNMKKLDPERMGYEFGLNFGKEIRQNLYLETSLSVMQLRENVSYSFTTGKVDTLIKRLASDGSFQATPVYVEGERQLKSSFTYGGLRVGATYFFLEGLQSRLSLTMAGGVNVLVKGHTEEYLNGELNETIVFPSEDNLLEQTNYNLLLGVGYNRRLHDKYELMLMPTLNYFLGSTFSKREPFGLRPYTLGVSFQVRRRLSR